MPEFYAKPRECSERVDDEAASRPWREVRVQNARDRLTGRRGYLDLSWKATLRRARERASRHRQTHRQEHVRRMKQEPDAENFNQRFGILSRDLLVKPVAPSAELQKRTQIPRRKTGIFLQRVATLSTVFSRHPPDARAASTVSVVVHRPTFGRWAAK